jgi:hypothetical protein
MKNIVKPQQILLLLIFSSIVFVNCSGNSRLESSMEEYTEGATQVYPTLSNSLPDLITSLSSPNDEIRVAAARKLATFGPDAEIAVPSLVQNLQHPNSEVRRSSVDALAALGSKAKPAISSLIVLLLTDTAVQPRRQTAISLGKIGDVSTVPALAKCLNDNDDGVAIQCAKSIGILTSQQFPDMNSTGYQIDQNGIPLIVLAAMEWWESSGQYKAWIDHQDSDLP